MGEPDEIFILQKIHMTELERLCLISISVPSFLKELQFLSKYFAKKKIKKSRPEKFYIRSDEVLTAIAKSISGGETGHCPAKF